MTSNNDVRAFDYGGIPDDPEDRPIGNQWRYKSRVSRVFGGKWKIDLLSVVCIAERGE